MSPAGNLPTLAEADAWSRLFLSSLNCSTSDVCLQLLVQVSYANLRWIHRLRSIPVASLQSTVLKIPKLVGPDIGSLLEHSGRGLLEWGPVID